MNNFQTCLFCVCFWQVVPVLTSLIHSVSAVRLYLPNDLRSTDHRLSVLKSLQVGHVSLALALLLVCYCCKE
jgi:hypothetical protein